ncbi:VOC family protein [Bacillus sp. B1-b2]|uniref:VOC family protein n=1 Tax=Bacillus sp. B1-b2 TaxID=2653201 RepID=UPI0012624DD4|nr:VOC family protein [Bacillus sp. B1-b2]KAB7672245.1 VOC family protein [Bacillus sp. B1-b2]
MISKLGQVMIYVNDQDKAAEFWTKQLNFVVKSDEDNGHMRWIEIAPTEQAETTLILHNKKLIAEMQPELNLGTPSLMFVSDNVEELYEKLTTNGITVGEMVEMGNEKIFNFADYEQNYFAVMEIKK